MRPVLISLLFLALAACQPDHPASDPPAKDIPAMTHQTCIADTLQHLVGQPLSALDLEQLPDPKRIIAPFSPVTMDYRLDRLNIEHDQERIVRRIYCG